MRELELIIFDLDGTLIDSAPEITRAVNRLRSSRALGPVAVEAIQRAIGHGVEDLLTKVFWSDLERPSGFDGRAKEQQVQEEFRSIYLEEVGRDLALFPGTLETLQELRARGLKLALVTNKPLQHTEKTLAHSVWRHLTWDFVAGGDSLAEKKPSPLPLLAACHATGVRTPGTAMVGDGRPDMLAARAAGIRGVGVSWGYCEATDLLEAGADDVVSSWPSLIGALGLSS